MVNLREKYEKELKTYADEKQVLSGIMARELDKEAELAELKAEATR